MANLLSGAGLFLAQEGQRKQQEVDIQQQQLGLNAGRLTLDRRLQYAKAAEDVGTQLATQIQNGLPRDLALKTADQLLGGLVQGMASDRDPQNQQFALAVNQKILATLASVQTPNETAAAKGQATVTEAGATLDAASALPPESRDPFLESKNLARGISTEAGKAVQDRVELVSRYGEGSPQVREFDTQSRDLASVKLQDARAGLAKNLAQYRQIVTGDTPLTSDQKANVEGKLRDDFTSATKEFVISRDAFQKIAGYANGKPSPAGDIALVFNFMKTLDPTSVVREGEFATARNAGSIPTRIRAIYNKVLGGEILAASQRADFVNQSQRMFSGQKAIYLQATQQYSDIAKRSGVDPKNVVTDLLAGVQDTKPKAAATAQTDISGATLDQLLAIDPSTLSDAQIKDYDKAMKSHGY